MSTLSDTLRRMASLVWPRRCAVCGGELPAGADTICTMCRYTAPLTGYWRMEDNPLAQRLDALAGVGRAAALIFFSGGGWRESIHGFKYGGRWRSARTLGRWLGAEMKSSGLYDDIDLVVPVPLHSERWEGVGGLFEVRHKERLAGRSILLVDDVFTTGATMTACIEAIRRAAPDCRISAAVLAVSRKGLGIDE